MKKYMRATMGIIFITTACYSDDLSLPENKRDPFGPVISAASVVPIGRTSRDEHIDLHFQDIEVRAVLQLLADFTGVNMVVGDGVKGRLTFQCTHILWQDALDAILTLQGLAKRWVGDILLIDSVEAFAKQAEERWNAREIMKGLAPLSAEWLPIQYARAEDIATMLQNKDNPFLSKRGGLSVDARTNALWLEDTPSRMLKMRKVVRELDVPVRQVLIEARIVNVTKDATEDLGIRWGVAKKPDMAEKNTHASFIPGLTGLPLLSHLNLDLPALSVDTTPISVGLALAKLASGVLLDLELSALESEGRAEMIANPRLMTTNQQPAVIQAGEDIPYQESTNTGATVVSFKKAVLSLKVTPQISASGQLLLALKITQNSDSGRRVQGVPIILTKTIETTVRVKHGQTIVLGGIYQQNKNQSITRLPFWGTLPGLEPLFRKKQTSMTREELLIFITPRIIASNLSVETE